jgi:Protein of unknown function (DUF1566)
MPQAVGLCFAATLLVAIPGCSKASGPGSPVDGGEPGDASPRDAADMIEDAGATDGTVTGAMESGAGDGGFADSGAADSGADAQACTDTCEAGANQCLTSTSLQSCAMQANGCFATTTQDCSATQGGEDETYVCERGPKPPGCFDPGWAEWPMPNNQFDVSMMAPNPASFTNNNDGTVTDNVTGLMWQSAPSSSTYQRAAAITYCGGLSLGGHTDWRVPSIIELLSLVDVSVSKPAIDTSLFPNTQSAPYMTATIYPQVDGGTNPCQAAYVDFTDGANTTCGSLNNPELVRCVR